MKRTPKDVLDGIKNLILPSQDKVEESVVLEEVATDVFTTEEEAKERAAELGSEGCHQIEQDGVVFYMPCETAEAYQELISKPEEAEEEVEAAEEPAEEPQPEDAPAEEEDYKKLYEEILELYAQEQEKSKKLQEELDALSKEEVKEEVELSEEVVETPKAEAPAVEVEAKEEVKEEKVEEFNHSPEKVTFSVNNGGIKRNTRVDRIFNRINNII